MNPGLVGAIAGCAIGLCGGIVGTVATIRNTGSPRERAFTVRAALTAWALGFVFLALLLLLPNPWRHLVWIPYGILLPLGITHWNRMQERIRREELAESGARVLETDAKA